MTTYFFQFATTAALVIAQIAPTLAQPVPPTAPSQGGPQVLPARPDVPQILPPRPGNGGPQIQPPRPIGPTPVRPPVRPLPPTPPVIDEPQILPPVYPGRNFAGVVRCESFNNRSRRCNVNTVNRVEIVRTLSGNCQRGRSWGFTRSYVWVERGCRAEFGYGYASPGNPYPVPQPQPIRDRGPSAGVVIAGVVVAGGLKINRRTKPFNRWMLPLKFAHHSHDVVEWIAYYLAYQFLIDGLHRLLANGNGTLTWSIKV